MYDSKIEDTIRQKFINLGVSKKNLKIVQYTERIYQIKDVDIQRLPTSRLEIDHYHWRHTWSSPEYETYECMKWFDNFMEGINVFYHWFTPFYADANVINVTDIYIPDYFEIIQSTPDLLDLYTKTFHKLLTEHGSQPRVVNPNNLPESIRHSMLFL